MADRATLMTREIEAHEFIPYGRHIDVHTITVGSQGLMTMVEIEGFAFETADIRGSLMAYLFERIKRTITGDRIVIAIDEFWKALGDPVFSDLAAPHPRPFASRTGWWCLRPRARPMRCAR